MKKLKIGLKACYSLTKMLTFKKWFNGCVFKYFEEEHNGNACINKNKENWQSSFYFLLCESPATHFTHSSRNSHKQKNTEEAVVQFHEDMLRLRKPMQLLGSRAKQINEVSNLTC